MGMVSSLLLDNIADREEAPASASSEIVFMPVKNPEKKEPQTKTQPAHIPVLPQSPPANAAEIKREAIARLSRQTEQITRRSMKLCVTMHLQSLCDADPVFAQKTLQPHKSMAQCFQYINRQAIDYLRQEGTLNGDGAQGGDVPDDLCYQWAEDYFRKAEEEQKPKPAAAAEKTGRPAKPISKPAAKPASKPAESFEQMTF